MSILAVFSATNCARAATDLPAGSAKGSLTYDGATAELKFAAAFVDRKDEREPIVLVISDKNFRWKNGFAKVFYFFRLTSSFPRRISRCAQIDWSPRVRVRKCQTPCSRKLSELRRDPISFFVRLES